MDKSLGKGSVHACHIIASHSCLTAGSLEKRPRPDLGVASDTEHHSQTRGPSPSGSEQSSK